MQEVLDFIAQELGVTIDRLTLRRYSARYGLGCLRGDLVTDTPFFLVEPAMEELSC